MGARANPIRDAHWHPPNQTECKHAQTHGTPTKRPPTKRPRLQNVLLTKRPSTKRPSTKRPAYKTSMDTKRPRLQNVLAYKMFSYGGGGTVEGWVWSKPNLQHINLFDICLVQHILFIFSICVVPFMFDLLYIYIMLYYIMLLHLYFYYISSYSTFFKTF
jgi:hypothetical protein